MPFHKYSKERLLKHEYCAHIINAKKVVCKCDKSVKLNQHYNEDYLDHHVANSGCKVNERQLGMLMVWFGPVQSWDRTINIPRDNVAFIIILNLLKKMTIVMKMKTGILTFMIIWMKMIYYKWMNWKKNKMMICLPILILMMKICRTL